MSHLQDATRAFISYAHVDKDLALDLYQRLSRGGVQVWIDEHELRVGDSLLERIAGAVANTDFFIALISKESAKSPWCRKELALASSGVLNRNGLRVLPVRIDGAPMPNMMGDQLFLDLSRNDVQSAADRLVADMAAYKAEEAQLMEGSQEQVVTADEERLAYERVINAGAKGSRAMAAVQLGDLMADQGNAAAAKEAFQLAAELEVENFSTYAAVRLGVMMKDDGELGRAEELLRSATAAENPKFDGFARLELGHVLATKGSLEEAALLYSEVVANYPGIGPDAAVGLGQVRSRLGDAVGAMTAYKIAIESDNIGAKAKALFLMGTAQHDVGNIDDAVKFYRLAGEVGSAEFSSLGYYCAGQLLENDHKIAEADDMYLRAVNLDHVPGTGWAARALAGIHADSGDVSEAVRFYELAIDKSDQEGAERARLGLGLLLASIDRVDDAKAAIVVVTKSSDPERAQLAFATLRAIGRGSLPGKPWES